MIRLLVVDDSPMMLQLLCSLLRSFGCPEIHKARSGGEALRILQHVPINLVITDWRLDGPNGGNVVITDWKLDGPNGGKLIRRVRADRHCPNREVPIIVLTGHAEAEQVLAARAACATDFLAKPISADRLFDRLADALDGSPAPARSAAEARPSQWTETLASWTGSMPYQRCRHCDTGAPAPVAHALLTSSGPARGDRHECRPRSAERSTAQAAQPRRERIATGRWRLPAGSLPGFVPATWRVPSETRHG